MYIFLTCKSLFHKSYFAHIFDLLKFKDCRYTTLILLPRVNLLQTDLKIYMRKRTCSKPETFSTKETTHSFTLFPL